MSRPVDWQKRYEAVLKRYNRLYAKFTKLQKDHAALKMKQQVEVPIPAWRSAWQRMLGMR